KRICALAEAVTNVIKAIPTNKPTIFFIQLNFIIYNPNNLHKYSNISMYPPKNNFRGVHLTTSVFNPDRAPWIASYLAMTARNDDATI
ncbi:MAG: hypothetical protein LBS88_06745, partial [Tannerellaceae bacterium]|nr:hypothetical protein [Tannerellaceae bacterium]